MSALPSSPPDTNALLIALSQGRDLCQRLGLPEEAATFERHIARLQAEQPTYEVLREEVWGAVNGIPGLRMLTKLGNNHSEFNRLQNALSRVLFPEIHEEQKRGRRSLEERIEEHCEKVMASSAKAEAREWLKERAHGFFKTDRRDVAEFVDDFYAAGAKEVLIGDIEEDQSALVGQSLIIVLPKQTRTRAKLFQIGSRAEEAFQCDHVTDKGQNYLYYPLD